jgi:hypothetical protein
MKSSKPPALATWLVEHVVPGDKNEALAGDLLEQFGQGRSASWYWRQVFVAMLMGLSKKLLILELAVGVTTLSTCLLFRSWGRIAITTVFQAIMRPGMALAWPLSLIYTMGCFALVNVLPLMVALSLYLGLTKGFSLRGFARGLLVGIFTVSLSMVMGWGLSPIRGGPNFVRYISVSLPLFFGLLLSMWTARSNIDGSGTAKSSV